MDSAPSPMPDSNFPELDAFRPYLTVLARGQIPVSMQARLDASDIVQETLLEAYRKRDQSHDSKIFVCDQVTAKRRRRDQEIRIRVGWAREASGGAS